MPIPAAKQINAAHIRAESTGFGITKEKVCMIFNVMFVYHDESLLNSIINIASEDTANMSEAEKEETFYTAAGKVHVLHSSCLHSMFLEESYAKYGATEKNIVGPIIREYHRSYQYAVPLPLYVHWKCADCNKQILKQYATGKCWQCFFDF